MRAEPDQPVRHYLFASQWSDRLLAGDHSRRIDGLVDGDRDGDIRGQQPDLESKRQRN